MLHESIYPHTEQVGAGPPPRRQSGDGIHACLHVSDVAMLNLSSTLNQIQRLRAQGARLRFETDDLILQLANGDKCSAKAKVLQLDLLF